MGKISGLPTDNTPTGDDYIVVNDTTTGATKRVLLSDLATYIGALTTKTTDGNSWKVYNFVTFKMYVYELNVASLAVTNGQRATAGTIPLPSGTSVANLKLTGLAWEGSYSGHAVVGAETGSGSGWSISVANQYNGGALTFAGKVRAIVVDS